MKCKPESDRQINYDAEGAAQGRAKACVVHDITRKIA